MLVTNMKLTFFIVIINMKFLNSLELNSEIVNRFCNFKSINLLTVFTCISKKERINWYKSFNQSGISIFLVNINEEFTRDYVLDRRYHHIGVLLDGDFRIVLAWVIILTMVYIVPPHLKAEQHLNFLRTHLFDVLQNIPLAIVGNMNNTYYFYETFHWLVFCKNKDHIKYLFSEAYLNINSDVIATISNGAQIEFYDVYNPASRHGGELKILPLKTELPLLFVRFKGSKYWFRKNMTGVQFKSAIVIPHLDRKLEDYLINDNDRQVNSLNRFQSVAVDHCKQMYNFSLHVERTNSWGYIQKPTGRFDGLVGLLERRVVDFGSSPLVYKFDRMPVVDYSFGNWILRSVFIYRRPKIEAQSYEIFLRPLATDVWLSISVMLIFITIGLKLAFSIEMYFLHKVKRGVDPSWSFLILFTLGAFCQQGATCYPRLFASRILSVFVFLFCILVYQFYSASIVSYLLMDPPRTIFNLKDLLQSSLKAGIEDILIDRDYFVQTTDPYAIQLFENKIKGPKNQSGFYPPLDGMKLVRQGGFALHVQTSTAYPIIEQSFTNEEICELEEVQMYRTQPMYTNLQKHSPFREMMNYCMWKMVEDGKMDGLRKHWDARKPACIDAAKKVIIHVSITEFSCGLKVLSYGMLICFVLLILENLIYYRYKFYERLGITICSKKSISNVQPRQILVQKQF